MNWWIQLLSRMGFKVSTGPGRVEVYRPIKAAYEFLVADVQQKGYDDKGIRWICIKRRSESGINPELAEPRRATVDLEQMTFAIYRLNKESDRWERNLPNPIIHWETFNNDWRIVSREECS